MNNAAKKDFKEVVIIDSNNMNLVKEQYNTVRKCYGKYLKELRRDNDLLRTKVQFKETIINREKDVLKEINEKLSSKKQKFKKRNYCIRNYSAGKGAYNFIKSFHGKIFGM